MILTYKNEAMIKAWANTFYAQKDGNFLVVQHYKDKMFYYFENVDGVYIFKLTSLNPPIRDENIA